MTHGPLLGLGDFSAGLTTGLGGYILCDDQDMFKNGGTFAKEIQIYSDC